MGVEIAAFVIGGIGIGFGLWQRFQSLALRREAQRLRLPVVEIVGDAGWEPTELGKQELRVHADMVNRGPGYVRDLQWGVLVAGAEHSHGRNHILLSEGEEITYEMFVLPEALVPKETQPDRITWWVRYTNAVGDRVEMRLSGRQNLSGPIVLARARRRVWPWLKPQLPVDGTRLRA